MDNMLEMDVDSPRIQCVCHIFKRRAGVNHKIIPLTDETWKILCEYVNAWKDVSGIGTSIATNFDASTAITQGYHEKCFLAFTNKQKLQRIHQNAMRKDCSEVSVKTKRRKIASDTNETSEPLDVAVTVINS